MLSPSNSKESFNEDSKLRPPLKWAGGKRWLVPHLTTIWEEQKQRRFVEPFCGGLSIPLALRPKSALLNDINPHLINLYSQLKRGLPLTIEMRNDPRLFYRHRARFNELINKDEWKTPEAAQLFYYLNRTCFNGLCRFNRRGQFNVPFGRHNSIAYDRDLSTLKKVFKQWKFLSCDIMSLPIKPDDFVYADPPYDVEFTTYSPGGFTWEDQVRTAEWLAQHKGPVLLSNQATKRIVNLYKNLGFQLRYLKAPRRISCTGDRTAAREVLAVKI